MLKTAIAYVLTVVGAILAFVFIRSRGEMLIAPAPAADSVAIPVAGGMPDTLWHLLLAMAAVVTVGRLLGRVFARIGQPPVIGEIVAGILLGPSLLGYLSPAAYAYV